MKAEACPPGVACPPSAEHLCSSDVNCDGAINILDVVKAVSIVLGTSQGSDAPCEYGDRRRALTSNAGVLLSVVRTDDGTMFLKVETDSPIAGVELWLGNATSDTAVQVNVGEPATHGWQVAEKGFGDSYEMLMTFSMEGFTLPPPAGGWGQ